MCVAPSPHAGRYIQSALEKGAKFIVCEPEQEIPFAKNFPLVSFIAHENPRFFLSEISAFLYPNHPPFLAAVTGTNGKSSVVSFTRQLFGLNNVAAASVGTLGVVTTKSRQGPTMSALTTPGALELYKLLGQLLDQNIHVAALEASSHGIHQYRLHHAPLACAGFTNLSQDHLDYHGTMAAYFEAKSRLFSEILGTGKTAVLNKDSAYFQQLSDVCKKRQQKIISYSLKQQAHLSLSNMTPTATGFSFDLTYEERKYEKLGVSLIGEFQLENLLCATGLALACDLSIDQCVSVFDRISPVDGRMDYVGSKNNAHIYVDYAHTPDALKIALCSLKKHCQEKLWVVFGCGGSRDSSKRPLMGQVAYEQAHHIIITDDNPRLENPSHIRAQILDACPGAKEIGNRHEAIAFAIAHLNPGDVLLVAGKGHERGQTVGLETLPFYDKDVIQTYLRETEL